MHALKPSLEFYRDKLFHLNLNTSSLMSFWEENFDSSTSTFSYSYIFHNKRMKKSSTDVEMEVGIRFTHQNGRQAFIRPAYINK